MATRSLRFLPLCFIGVLIVNQNRYKVLAEARRSFFTIRLWDSGDLLEAILKSYDRFPDALQAELPLKHIWSLVLEEQ